MKKNKTDRNQKLNKWRDRFSMFMDKKKSILSDVSSSQVDLKNQHNPFRIPASYFVGINKT